MDTPRTNRPTLDALRHMPVSDVIALPAEHLALLQTDAREALDAAKRMQDWIEAAIALRYEQRAIGARAAAGKDTGTVRFRDGAVEIAVDLPKKVDWDQARLATLSEQIRRGQLQGLGAGLHRLAGAHPRRLRAGPHGSHGARHLSPRPHVRRRTAR